MKFRIILPLLIIGLVLVQSCRTPEPENGISGNLVKSFDNKVLYDWNEMFLKIDKDANNFRPYPGPRAMAYISWATYEACVSGMPEYNSLKNLPQFAGANIPNFDPKQAMYWPEVINEVQSYLMKNMFEKVTFFTGSLGNHITSAEAQKMIENLKVVKETDFLKKINTVTFNNSKAWGEEVARAVWLWSTTDNYGHEAYLNPLNNDDSKSLYYDWRKNSLDANGNRIPGKWAPTNDNPNGGMFPLIGRARTFASDNTQKICRPPMSYSEIPGSLYYIQNEEVLSRSSMPMSYEDQWIAEFWSDDLEGLTFGPALRLLACLDQIMTIDNSKLDKAIYATTLLGLASNDFAVVCWNSKYYYNIERPENYIKDVLKRSSYEPHLEHPYTGVKGITPSFPAYPSGHSTFGGGGFYAIAAVYGNDFTFTDRCHQDRTEFIGTARTYTTLSDAGYEYAVSRIPLGVNIRQDCEEGYRLGQEIAKRFVALPWKK